MKSSERCYVAGMEGVWLGILEVIFGLSESGVISGLVFFPTEEGNLMPGEDESPTPHQIGRWNNHISNPGQQLPLCFSAFSI